MLQNKHITRLSLIGLFLNIIASMVWYHYFILEEIILKRVIAENSKIANLYKSEVWDMNAGTTQKLSSVNYKELMQDQDFINFVKSSAKFFTSTNSGISLFDNKGNKFIASNHHYLINLEPYIHSNLHKAIALKIKNYLFDDYSNNSDSLVNNFKNTARNYLTLYDIIMMKIDKYFLKDVISSKAFTKAFEGKTTHNFILKALVMDGKLTPQKATFISSYIPIIDNKYGNFQICGVIEITTNITEQWLSISYLEEKILLILIIIFIIFFLIVVYNARWAVKLISKQFEDARELKENKIRAEAENFAKTQFLANITHELRTPLNSIIGFSDIILAKHDQTIPYKDYIADINNAGKHLLSVITDILDFSKASADRLKVEFLELDLNKLLVSTLRLIKPKAEENNIQIIIQLPPEKIVIKADPKRFKQVLLNILSNAIKFTDANGCVTVEMIIDKVKKAAVIKIIDSGIGIAEEDMPKIFSVFGKIEKKSSREYEGTGLGLAITKKLVELMKGEITLSSKLGVGTTIVLTFPYERILSSAPEQ